jgi:2-aminoadipate transaminase
LTSPLDPDALTIPKIDAAASARGGDLVSFAGGTPRTGDFPIVQLSEDLAASLSPRALAYGPARGERSLLDALHRHFAREGVDASPERTMVTSGAMPGLDLVFRCALDPEDIAVVESPTYSDSLISLSLARAQIVELPMDSDGARVDALPSLAEEANAAPRLIYVIPTFHNPTGLTMSYERRLRLIDLARDLNAVLVEDDAYGPFRFGGEPLPSLASLSDDVVSVRSLSKIVAPGLRVGCVIGPPPFLERLEQAHGGTHICSSPLNQEAVARFIGGEAVYPHIVRLNERFAARRDAMLEALSRHFTDLGADWTHPEGGMFIWVRLAEGFDAGRLLEPALDQGVSFVPGSLFSVHGNHRNALRLCFAAVDSGAIAEGIGRLRSAFGRLPETTAR